MQQDPAIVEVQTTRGGKVISIQESDGTVRRIEIGTDGRISSADAAAPGGAISVAPAPAPAESRRKALPDGLVDMMGIIFGAVTVMSLGTPLVKAWARRFEKRADLQQQVLVEQRLAAIEQAIESVAVEVERISEGQRFTTKLLADRAPAELERVR
ncbi:hypothetical protein [Gemmatimonas sp.]|uniref:hypothetical protein n=1 Tax=Gemmatimonas sp. TaxID=1962908 RepID=UPI00333F3BF8